MAMAMAIRIVVPRGGGPEEKGTGFPWETPRSRPGQARREQDYNPRGGWYAREQGDVISMLMSVVEKAVDEDVVDVGVGVDVNVYTPPAVNIAKGEPE